MKLTSEDITAIYKLCTGYITSLRTYYLSSCPYKEPDKREEYMKKHCSQNELYNQAVELRDKFFLASSSNVLN